MNKTSTGVYLKHVPTGIEVKCMKDRSQSINRFLARRELIERVSELSGMKTTYELKRDRIRREERRRERVRRRNKV